VKTIAPLLLIGLFLANPRAMFRSPRETIARELLMNFAAGRLDAAAKDFNETLRTTATVSYLRDLKRQIDAQVGGFQALTDVRRGRDEGFPLIEMICKYEKGPVAFRVAFDVTDRVAAVYVSPILPSAVDPALEAEARAVLADFNAGRFDGVSGRFGPAMRGQLTTAGLTELRNQVSREFGAFQSVTDVRQKEEEHYKAIELTASFEKSPVLVRVVFDAEKRVVGLKIGALSRH
jgi:Protein of unknown function (DUF3887)